MKLHVGLFTLITFTFDANVYEDGLLRISVSSKINNFLSSPCSEPENTWSKSDKRLYRRAMQVQTLQ